MAPATIGCMHNLIQFIQKVLKGFRANQGFLLSGAIAYYTLLSIIPMIALILVVLSQFQEPQQLLDVLREYLVLVTPGQADVVLKQISVFLEHWEVIGLLGFVLLYFAFRLSSCETKQFLPAFFFHHF